MAPIDDNSDEPTRLETTRRVTLVGAGVNALLALAQLVGGFFTHSQALIADGVHTLSDLASDFIVLVAAHEAHRDADEEHPYGHGRIETLATGVLGLGLVVVGIGIGWDAADRLLHPERPLNPTPMAFPSAAAKRFIPITVPRCSGKLTSFTRAAQFGGMAKSSAAETMASSATNPAPIGPNRTVAVSEATVRVARTPCMPRVS